MMTGKSTQPLISAKQFPSRLFLLAVCCAVAFASGCPARKHPAIPWKAAVLVRPILPAAAGSTTSDTREPPPDLQLEIPPPPSHLAGVRSVPARPRVAPTHPAENSSAEKSAEPLIAPQLTAVETAAAKQETQQSLDHAERNLAMTRGWGLNAAQTDLASKVQGFMDDAREAMHNDDWTRARNLAKKAEVLSEELSRPQ